jgi:hypothetical protein
LALPLVPLVVGIGSTVAGVTGIAASAVGGLQIRQARMQIESDDARLGRCREALCTKVDHTNVVLQDFGRVQELAQRDVIIRLEDFLVRHGKQVRAKKHLILDGIDGSNTQVPGLAQLNPDVVGWVQGLIGSAAVGVATPAALRAAGTQLGKASTGTAIKALHGAARESALLALFGGGTRAAGGGGMALGGPMLNAAGTGAALLTAGVVVKNQGTRALTEAEAVRNEVDAKIAELRMREAALRGARKLAREQETVLSRLVSQATEALNVLESEPFDADLHTGRLQLALILVTSVGQVIAAFYENVNHDGTSGQLTFKYRDATTEATND